MIHIPLGKTKDAGRDLPMTAETHHALLRRFEEQGRPEEGGVSGSYKSRDIAMAKAGLEHFELYCFRHTFLPILAPLAVTPYTECRIAGHGDIKMAMRYCHTQNEYIVNAFSRLPQFRQKGYGRGVPSTIGI